jgi:hypothetical protein
MLEIEQALKEARADIDPAQPAEIRVHNKDRVLLIAIDRADVF